MSRKSTSKQSHTAVLEPEAPKIITPEAPPTIYERVGGDPAIRAAVDAFYGLVLADSMLAPFFEGVDMNRLKSQQRAFFAQALGGPRNYRGADMRRAHAGHPIEQKHFDRVAGHLGAALKSLGVPKDTIHEIIAAVAPLSGEIVNTATLIPDSKTAAAPTSLTETLEGMRGALDSLGTNVFVADRDLRLIYMNRRASDIMRKLGATIEKLDRKSTRLNSSHVALSRMPSSA